MEAVQQVSNSEQPLSSEDEGIAPADCPQLWEHWARCKHWIEGALPYCYGTHTIEDVEDAIRSGDMQFWPGERCALVTQIGDHPRLRALTFFLVGGDMDEIVNRMEPLICDWARSKGCTRVAQTGRKGWGRVLVPNGYKTVLSVMIKDLDDVQE